MKYSLLHIALLLFFPLHVFSQDVQLKRQVNASAGNAVQVGNLMLSSTVGETVVGRSDSSQFYITQGFQQASFGTIADISYEVSTKSETCPDTQDGEVILTNLTGCENGNYQVLWENGSTGLSIANLSAGWYSFQIIACGRIIQDSAFVSRIYESSCLLRFYTAFSPNGDNVNDLWVIDNINAEPNNRNEITIFNRWGNKINDFVNYDNISVVWDGKDRQGKDVTEGTYYFQLKINDQEYSGYIELTR